MQRLTDQVAVVTGAARGIGRGIASVLGAEGARVVLCDVDGEFAESTAAILREQGLDALAVATDVTDRSSVEAMAARVVAEHGRIDVLAANAGIYPSADLAALDDDAWNRVMDLNVTGAVRAVQACLATMTARGYGRIVLTSSITGPVTGAARKRADPGLRGHQRGAPTPDAVVDSDGPVRLPGGRRLGRAFSRLAGGRLHHRPYADRRRRPGAARSSRLTGRTAFDT
jgi:3-oxoacyl-[acyl-carrier protein] reductase